MNQTKKQHTKSKQVRWVKIITLWRVNQIESKQVNKADNVGDYSKSSNK